MAMMSDVKEGLEILLKYGDQHIAAEHDILYASDVPPDKISDEDKANLKSFRWHWNEEQECWAKFT